MNIDKKIQPSDNVAEDEAGAQRLSRDKLRAWRDLDYGMFIHFGLSTYLNHEMTLGTESPNIYNPTHLDVDQWVQVARDSGMKYALLTAKHVSGHCLWPTDQTDFHVGNNRQNLDVAGAFVEACNKHGIMPGLYYCSWDNRNKFGSVTPTRSLEDWGGNWISSYTTQRYRDFQFAQIEELLTRYGPIGEVWIDIPGILGFEGRQQQYQQIAELQPDAIIMLNHGLSNGSEFNVNYAWPTDIMAIERFLPSSNKGYQPWFHIEDNGGEAKPYYIPAEVCDPIGNSWFFEETDQPRTPEELLGMRLICQARDANLLLNVPPDKSGVIPKRYIEALSGMDKLMSQIKNPNQLDSIPSTRN